MRRLLTGVVLLGMMTAACGGTSSNPTSPSSSANASSGGGPASPSGSAAVTGIVQGSMPSQVSVVGTALTTAVDASGRFALSNVPAGDVQLQFSGATANGTVALTSVGPLETIDLVVSVAGSAATIESQFRSSGSESELEGRVEALPPTTAALSFKAAGKLVTTASSTVFQDGGASRSFSSLEIGMRVHVKGAPSGDAIAATLVELQNSNADIPVEVNGVVSLLTGSASAFQFSVNGTMVEGDANTSFFGDGDKADSFADLKNDLRVEVKGQQKNGFVYATRINVNTADAPPSPPEDTSASIEGPLTSKSGSTPNLSLTVAATTVRTSAATTVKRRGDVQTLDTLARGQTLHVVGTRRSDGSIDARLIEIEDDATGGAFEIQGAMGGLKGACPSVTFVVNGYSIATNASTTFDSACSALKSGDKVTVDGTKQADGSVLATSVKQG